MRRVIPWREGIGRRTRGGTDAACAWCDAGWRAQRWVRRRPSRTRNVLVARRLSDGARRGGGGSGTLPFDVWTSPPLSAYLARERGAHSAELAAHPAQAPRLCLGRSRRTIGTRRMWGRITPVIPGHQARVFQHLTSQDCSWTCWDAPDPLTRPRLPPRSFALSWPLFLP